MFVNHRLVDIMLIAEFVMTSLFVNVLPIKLEIPTLVAGPSVFRILNAIKTDLVSEINVLILVPEFVVFKLVVPL